MDIFKKAARLLVQQSRPDPLIDWKDADERRDYCAQKAREAREALLPADRRCPCCGETKARPRQWEVLRTFKLGAGEMAEKARASAAGTGTTYVAVCKGCAMRHFKEARG